MTSHVAPAEPDQPHHGGQRAQDRRAEDEVRQQPLVVLALQHELQPAKFAVRATATAPATATAGTPPRTAPARTP